MKIIRDKLIMHAINYVHLKYVVGILWRRINLKMESLMQLINLLDNSLCQHIIRSRDFLPVRQIIN